MLAALGPLIASFGSFVTSVGDAVKDIVSRIRPNILVAMIIVGALGWGIAKLALETGNGELASAAGVGAIVAIGNLAGKILEKE